MNEACGFNALIGRRRQAGLQLGSHLLEGCGLVRLDLDEQHPGRDLKVIFGAVGCAGAAGAAVAGGCCVGGFWANTAAGSRASARALTITRRIQFLLGRTTKIDTLRTKLPKFEACNVGTRIRPYTNTCMISLATSMPFRLRRNRSCPQPDQPAVDERLQRAAVLAPDIYAVSGLIACMSSPRSAGGR